MSNDNKDQNIIPSGQDGGDWHVVVNRNAKRNARRARRSSQMCEGLGEDGPMTVKKKFNVNVFLTRISPDVPNNDVTDYIKRKVPDEWSVNCRQLKSRFDTYKSFLVQIQAEDRDVISKAFDSNFWSKGAFVKRYFQKRGENITDTQNGQD